MNTLEDTVRSVVEEFMKNEVLFTALDVSNGVKLVLPHAKHREVRDAVRSMFTTDIETQDWARTPITVNLADGTTAEALLYHPLSDSWDLDRKYDDQRRGQTAFRPVTQAKAVLAQAQAQTVTVPVAQGMTQTASVPVVTPSIPMPTARTLWNNMFKTQPSLFPRK